MTQLTHLREKLPDIYRKLHRDWDVAVFPDHHQEGPSLAMRPSVVAVLASINERVALELRRKNGRHMVVYLSFLCANLTPHLYRLR